MTRSAARHAAARSPQPRRTASAVVTGSPARTPCRTWARTSAPRTTRGPGRLKWAGPSSTHTSPDRTAGTSCHPGRVGVRAQVIDKDRNPHWSPDRLSGVTDADTARYFAPLGDDRELALATADSPQEVPW